MLQITAIYRAPMNVLIYFRASYWRLALLSICFATAWQALGAVGQTISWVAPAGHFLSLNAPHAIEARASSGLPVSLSVVAGPATIADGMITITGPGTVMARAEQAAFGGGGGALRDAGVQPVGSSRR